MTDLALPELPAHLADRLSGWRARGQAIAVTVSTPEGRWSPGEVFVTLHGPASRRWRAARWWIGLWLGALAFLVVPILHFVVTPLLLVGGPLVAARVARIDRTVHGGVAPCPRCGAALWIGAMPLQWPLRETCARCYLEVRVSPVG